MNEWALSHVCSTDVVPGFKGKGSAMAARSRTPTRERPPSPSWGTRMQEVEEVPQVEEAPQFSLAAHQALLAARERELRRAWSRQRAYDLATDAMRQLSHASNLVERVFHTPAEAEHPSGGPWREGITFQERGVAEMVEAQLNIVIELLNTLLGSLARSEQEVSDASLAAATASHLNCVPSAWHESALRELLSHRRTRVPSESALREDTSQSPGGVMVQYPHGVMVQVSRAVDETADL